jgi:hypothetical protein
MKFEQSRDLLFYFCKKYELDQGRTHLLLSELESISRNQETGAEFVKAELKLISAGRRERLQKKD